MNKLFTLFFLFFLIIVGNNKLRAHSVQVGYCYNCNGDLRIWVEHWHANAAVNSTTMTLNVTVNGVTTQQTGNPVSNLQNTPVGNLPGCTTPITIFGTCPGQANTYNDWVNFDFPGMPTNTPITIEIISGNTVFTEDGCGMYPASTGLIIIPPPPTFPDIVECGGNGNTVGPFNFPVGNTWTNSNPAIGIPASGTGNIPAFTPTNGPTPQTATITMTNTCGTSSFNITINPSPVPFFSAPGIGGGSVCPGQPVTFTNLSTPVPGSNIVSYEWDFGDGSPSVTTQSPTHIFPLNPLTYNVTLTATDANGCSSDTTLTINFGGPTAAFTTANICEGIPVSFTDASTPTATITNWNWDFNNDGVVDNTQQNPSYSYPGPGTYQVELMVEANGGCKDSIVHTVVVNPMPTSVFTADDECIGSTTIFNNTSTISSGNVTWSWDFDDGSPFDNTQNPTHTYTASGTYNVTLTVTSDSGCIANLTVPVDVFDSPTASFTTADVCQNLAAQFTDQSAGNGGTINQWDWDFDYNGVTHYTDNINQNPSNNYAAAGTYTVELIVTTSVGCSDTVSNPITIHPMPNAAYTHTDVCYTDANTFTDNSNVSSGTITNWDWDFDDNSPINNTQNPTYTYGSDGAYNVTLVVTTDQNCKDTVTHTVNVWSLPVVDFTPTEVCLNTPTQFQDLTTVNIGNSVAWAWDFDDGTNSNAQNPIHTYPVDGPFQVTLVVTTNHGCVDSTTKTVTINPLPQVSFSADTLSGCSPVIVNFTDNSVINAPGNNVAWDWNFGNGMTSTQQNPTGISFENSSNTSVATFGISLTVTSDKGCVIKDTITNMITSYPIPTAAFTYGPEPTNIYDAEITFIDNSIIASQWIWDLGDGASSTDQNPVHHYTDSGSYYVTLYMENIYGCRDTASKMIRIDPTFAIFIPNAFTPDGDNVNDFFFVKGYGITQLETLVFDRWGVLVYEGYQLDSKWDGSYKGKLGVTDVYPYKIRARDLFGEWHEFTGKVTLLK